MSKAYGLAVLLLLLLCTCAPVSGAGGAGSATPTPRVQAAVVDAPPPAPMATPQEPYYTACADDGVSGVGTVRGNTNGNLEIGGHAV